MDQGEKGMKLKHYLYRVEFQARLAPHIHGCAWMRSDEMKNCYSEGTNEYEVSKVVELIDKYVTCQIPDDQVTKKIVEGTQTHSCTKTCRKKEPDC